LEDGCMAASAIVVRWVIRPAIRASDASSTIRADCRTRARRSVPQQYVVFVALRSPGEQRISGATQLILFGFRGDLHSSG
jgi:hypothetical protein